MLRAAAMRQPAHDRFVSPEHLHPVDAEIEVVFLDALRPLGDDERPGDERRGLARPAGLDGKLREVDVAPLQHHLLAGGGGDGFRLHRHDGAQQGQHGDRLAEAARRFGLAQEGKRLAHFAQVLRVAPLDGAAAGEVRRYAAGDPLDRAEAIDEDGHGGRPPIRHLRRLEDNGRPLFGEQARLDFGHLQNGRNGFLHPGEVAGRVELVEEVAKGGIGHWRGRLSVVTGR